MAVVFHAFYRIVNFFSGKPFKSGNKKIILRQHLIFSFYDFRMTNINTFQIIGKKLLEINKQRWEAEEVFKIEEGALHSEQEVEEGKHVFSKFFILSSL